MSDVRAVTAAIEGVPVQNSLGGLRQPSADRLSMAKWVSPLVASESPHPRVMV